MFIELPHFISPAADTPVEAAETFEGPQTVTAEPMPRRPRRGGEAASIIELMVRRSSQRRPSHTGVDADGGGFELTFTAGR
jgi:hypothetical protein